MRVWCDVYDSTYTRLSSGPVTAIKRASFKRALDGAGSFDLIAVGTDAQALDLLTNERRVKIYGETLSGAARLLGDGIIRQRELVEQAGSVELRITGPDALDELKRVNVLLARTYQDTLQNVINSLIGLVSGWAATVDTAIASNTIEARFDGVSVLAAMQDIADRYGYHLRLDGSTTRQIEISEFGNDNGLRISKVEVVTSETILNNELLMVQRLSQGQSSEDVYNWLLPVGAGEGVAALTLEKSTRTSPYTIQATTGPDGTTLYFISDASSISSYGTIQKVGQFKNVAPISNSDADIVAAANALYDAAVEDLQHHKQPTEHYAVTVKNAQVSIQPGDKIELDYKAQVQTAAGLVDYLNIRDTFWILDVREAVGTEGTSATLTISNIDQRITTPAERVMAAIEQINLRNLQPTTTASVRSYVYDREIDSTHNSVVPVEFTNATLYAQRVRLRIKTSPFRSTAASAASGGGSTQTSASGGGATVTSANGGAATVTSASTSTNHTHVIGSDQGADATAATQRRYQVNKSGGGVVDVYFGASGAGGLITSGMSTADTHTHSVSVPDHTHSVTVSSHTHSVTIPAHTHAISYGITDDTTHPQSITVSVNGVNKTNDLFGSATLAPSNAAIDLVADSGVLTGLLVNASGGLRQEHDITIACGSGQGRVEVTIEIYEITQAIAVV